MSADIHPSFVFNWGSENLEKLLLEHINKFLLKASKTHSVSSLKLALAKILYDNVFLFRSPLTKHRVILYKVNLSSLSSTKEVSILYLLPGRILEAAFWWNPKFVFQLQWMNCFSWRCDDSYPRVYHMTCTITIAITQHKKYRGAITGCIFAIQFLMGGLDKQICSS